MNHNDWLYATRILNWAEEKQVAVIMPAGENKAYMNNDAGDNHENYLATELVAATRQLFPLSEKREDTFIAGLSMGGFGAIRTGLRYPHIFGYIAGLSSAIMRKSSAKGISRKWDYQAEIENLLASNKKIPEIFISCGTEDSLIHANRGLHEFLIEKGIAHTYIEEPGSHDWDFWDRHIYKVLEWLPLESWP